MAPHTGEAPRRVTYAYVGPGELADTVRSARGARIDDMPALTRFLAERPQDELDEPFTFVVDLSGTLRLAPRRSEHVACAVGEQVLAAGELGFSPHPEGWAVSYSSNQSTGYCPDVTCWTAVVRSLDRAGIPHTDTSFDTDSAFGSASTSGSGFTHPIVFRCCPSCGEWNTVRDDHFVCAFCDGDLLTAYGVAPMDLALLADDEGNSVRITVLGRHPLAPDALAAEVVVETSFVTGRLDLYLSRSRLTKWEQALDRAAGGEDAAWMTVERGPSVVVRLMGERGCPEVVVEDESGSMATVCVPVDLPEDWVDEHRRRLRVLTSSWSSFVELRAPED